MKAKGSIKAASMQNVLFQALADIARESESHEGDDAFVFDRLGDILLYFIERRDDNNLKNETTADGEFEAEFEIDQAKRAKIRFAFTLEVICEDDETGASNS